ncbi:LEM domain-containing protein 1 isoform X8 [Notolabrus celidotus]|uniref:LEM domain-containing protein 1 isoform X8 n=1 Tax=Notolabrus celidotus TaxID=1203425 RepID=UPI00148FC94A|nr:LEM domain-containing protein 1 isoform X8 [Notolabrus celidotus]
MPLFQEDPAHLSKSRLKSDLVSHNVALPPAKSKKEVYVGLHLKHIDQKHAADFSSDEEDQAQDMEDKDSEDAEVLDPSALTDDDLKAALLQHGVKAGPIVASTRALYEKKLRTLLQSNGHELLNGTEKDELYSDSEEEEENGEEEGRESESEGEIEETVEQSEDAQQERGKVLSGSQSVKPNSCSSFSSQAFSITQMVEEMESQASLSASTDTEKGLNGSNVQDRWSRSSRQDISNQDKNNMRNNTLYYTPKSSPCIRGMKPHTLSQEPVKDIYKEMFPDAVTTPTGIYASRRRPIKGAAGRPIQYAYPDSPLSPTTLERREVERRLVPIHIQLVVFFIVACLLYLFYVFAEDGSFTPVMDLLDSLNQESDSGEGLML